MTSIFLNELFLHLVLSSDLVPEESLRKGNMGGMGTSSRGGHLPIDTSRGLAESTLPQRHLDCPDWSVTLPVCTARVRAAPHHVHK